MHYDTLVFSDEDVQMFLKTYPQGRLTGPASLKLYQLQRKKKQQEMKLAMGRRPEATAPISSSSGPSSGNSFTDPVTGMEFVFL